MRRRSHKPPARPRGTLRVTFHVVTLALGVHLVVAQLAGLESTALQLAHARWWLPVLVVTLQALSVWANGEVVRNALRQMGAQASRRLVQRAVLVGMAVGRTLPAGNAAGVAVTVDALRRSGVDPVVAGTVLAGSGALSLVVFAGLVPVGVALNVSTGQLGSVALAVVVIALAILVAAAVTPWVFRHPRTLAERTRRLAAFAARGPLRRHLDPGSVHAVVLRSVAGVRRLAADRRTVLVCVGWALASLLLDIAVVVALATTIGRGTPLTPIVLAYVVAQLSSFVPVTPGGVGIVESVMIGALVAAGAPPAAASVTVLGWRLVSHWLPLAVGLTLLPALRPAMDPGGHAHRP